MRRGLGAPPAPSPDPPSARRDNALSGIGSLGADLSDRFRAAGYWP
jgi:hypothetical protein